MTFGILHRQKRVFSVAMAGTKSFSLKPLAVRTILVLTLTEAEMLNFCVLNSESFVGDKNRHRIVILEGGKSLWFMCGQISCCFKCLDENGVDF